MSPSRDIPAKSVPEMSADGDEPPADYIVKECSFAPVDLSSPAGPEFPIPLIDVSLLSSDSLSNQQITQQDQEAALLKLRSALITAGCFQAVGHGMSESFVEKVREAALQFYALPAEEKRRCARAEDESEGYGCDKVVSDTQILDWSNRLTLTIFPEHKRRTHLWPQNPPHFSDLLHEYAVNVRSMMNVLYKAMARSLNLEEDSFFELLGEEPGLEARVNFYPPCSRPDLVLGLKPHTDRSIMTVLLQDKQVEGLQFLINGKWVKAPLLPHALVVNLGDQMEIMSNGVFRSPLHRVATNSDRLRISVALLNEPDPEKEIGPVEVLVDEKTPRMYKNVKNYGFINYEAYQKGKVAIDIVKIKG